MASRVILLHHCSSTFFIFFKWVPVVICGLLLSSTCSACSSASYVESLPGFGPLPFKLETGYVGVDEKDEVQLFYYFVESERNPLEDPLVLWLTGGPGCSGISGLVYEIGPLRFNKIKYNGTLPSLTINPFSWTKVSSVIFIDAPVGTGFSYSKTWESSWTGDRLHAHQCYTFLRKVMQLLLPNRGE
ncbi:serine carboxypeptidase-like 1 isoform X2 [Punica granatum]|uniref:Serine carboxypeptidase-like 1 isoform X2 n=1 Tax=Punica granatum TaxID=22663 RepID=A0A6P8DIV4_PUNGR|nr:serine carboxypeptidase-like 1 isoform X2 [Punica granatum]